MDNLKKWRLLNQANRRNLSWIVRGHIENILYAFYSVHENTKGGKPGKLHRPKRNYTFNRIAVPSDYIMNGGKIKEVKNYENTVQTIQNHIYFFR